jgi:hypothetical protein
MHVDEVGSVLKLSCQYSTTCSSSLLSKEHVSDGLN